jgi:hypothetical protein
VYHSDPLETSSLAHLSSPAPEPSPPTETDDYRRLSTTTNYTFELEVTLARPLALLDTGPWALGMQEDRALLFVDPAAE